MITWKAIFPNPVMRANIERNFTNDEKKFFKKMQAASHVNVLNTRSDNTCVLDAPEMRRIRSFIEEHVNQFAWRVFSADPKHEFYITQSWLNYTKQGQAHHRHIHTNSLISGVLYINSKTEVDAINFHRHSAAQVQILMSDDQVNEYNAPAERFSVGTGDLIIFPSNITHSVDQTTGDHTRISLAFNAFVRGELGSEELLNRLSI